MPSAQVPDYIEILSCKDRNEISKAFYLVASSNFWQGKPDAAERCCLESMRFQAGLLDAHSMGAQINADRLYMRSIVLCMARISYTQKKFDKAISYCRLVWLLTREHDLSLDLLEANTSGLEGLCYFGLGRMDEAQTKLTSALKFTDRNEIIIDQEARALLAIYERKGRTAEAKALCSQFHLQRTRQ